MTKEITLRVRDCNKNSPYFLAKYEIKRCRKVEAVIYEKVDKYTLNMNGLSWDFKTMEEAKQRILDNIESFLNCLGFTDRIVYL